MKKTFLNLALSATLILGAATAQAQIKMPAGSPASKIEQAVGLSTVTVEYSRPSMKGREIFGDLVPMDKLWRTGANASTKIKFSDDVTIEGNKVPAGEYALYSIPGKSEWTIVLHKNTKHWGDGGAEYKQAEDQLRFKVKPQQNPRETESFTINFANLKADAADVEILWDNTIAAFTVKTDVDSKVMAQIQEKVVNNKDAKPADYAAAASYYFEADKDDKQALAWIKKANATDAKFWNVHLQAKIEAKLKDYKTAIKTAEKSKAMAQEAKNADYVALNDKMIASWKNAK